jgi:OOP family OmpA-OmpF porin
VRAERHQLASALAAIAAFFVLLASADALAQSTASGFAVGRFNPSERGSDWFASDSLDVRGGVRPAIGVVGDYAHRPLVIYNPDGTVASSIVRNQLIVHGGAALNLWDRLRIAFDVPVAVWQDGHGGTLNGVSYPVLSSAAVGDLRASLDLRVAGTYGDPITFAIGGQAFLPTGDQTSFLSDGSVRLLPHMQIAGDLGPIAYALSAGYMYHADETPFGGYPRGGEIVGTAALGVRALDHKLLIGPEVYGATVVTNSAALGALRQTPMEGLFGAHFNLASDWRAGVGAGTGLTRGFGEPAVRVVAMFEWFPAIVPPPPLPPEVAEPPPPPDRDKDGIPDESDACPDEPGVKTDDPKTNGCPPPPADRDKDGIPDTEDACPDVPGVKTADPKTNGCPPDPDRDKDGIRNEDDACPDEPGPSDPDPKKNGCPKAFIQGNQIKILDQVKFATGSAAIVHAKESDEVLEAVAKVLRDHPEVKSVRVEGHTDNVGTAALNKKLSTSRAASVVKWLSQHGIEGSRLSSAGFGFDMPIDTNDTTEGRKNNRRVEFHIEDQSNK